MHQTCCGAGSSANTNTPPEVARHGTCGTPDYGASYPANGCTFSRRNTRIGFDILISQDLAFCNILMGLGFTNFLEVCIGIKNGAGCATCEKKIEINSIFFICPISGDNSFPLLP